MTTTVKTMQEAALEYVDKGFFVFPCCWPTESGACGCGRNHKGRDIGKRPLTDHGFQDATQTHQGVKEYWTRWPNANIGWWPKRNIVLDEDNKNDSKGAESLAKMQQDYEPLPATLTNLSGSHLGHHFIYKNPTDKEIGNVDLSKVYPGIDIRADKGYILLPPSLHLTGWRYETQDNLPIATAPEWLITLLTTPSKNTNANIPASNSSDSEKIPNGHQDDALYRLACAYRAKGDGEQAIFAKLKIDVTRCEQDPADPFTDKDLFDMAHRACKFPAGVPTKPGISRHLTDMGNAERLIDNYGDKIRFSYERKSWLIWTGKCWKWDDGSGIMQLAHKVARSIYGEITVNDDEDAAKVKAKWAASSESNQRLCAMVTVAESMASITVDQLDCDVWLLNANNGTINLKTGVLQPHNPADLITRGMSTNYNPDATSEEWVKFLKRTFGDKKDLIAFVQRALGYSITGSQGEMAIFFCHGEGWNGKSTLLGACRLVLGEYAAEVEPAAFMIDKNRGTGPNEAIASLYNVNFVTSTEIEEGQRLSTALLKRMTGGESLRCEHKFERGFNYKPRYKLWMSGNHEPEISDTTKSIKNRFKKVPFLFTISVTERVQHYDEVLAEKYSEAILAWLVKGCLEWQRTGLGEPSEVKEATQSYFDNQDVLHDFLAECKEQASETCFKSELYKVYEKWCDDNGDKYVLGKKTFNTRIAEKGFLSDRGAHNKPIWRGIRPLTDIEKGNATNVTNVTEKTVSFPSRDNQLKLPVNSVTKVDKVTPSDVKSPKRLLSIDPCPVCGSENIGVWPDGTDGYYCLDCYPNFNEEPNF